MANPSFLDTDEGILFPCASGCVMVRGQLSYSNILGKQAIFLSFQSISINSYIIYNEFNTLVNPFYRY